MNKTMKNVGSLVIVLVILTLLLSSCSFILQGTYSNLEFGYGTQISFSGNSFTKINIGLLSKTVSTGKFRLTKDTITLVYDEDPASENVASFEKGDGYIKIGGTVYLQEKK